ncbi:hypothetical protein OIU84_015207 [Salix udensis]|uniref:Protein EXORDIUM-like 5 n=1 Tax=Salix udensis TaxID=889485 RepID=A0AAD6JDP6_9ROSI|nr:hypothetical protein OIU84_015207 [Salix udensis]
MLLLFTHHVYASTSSPQVQTLNTKPDIINPKLPPRTLSSSKKFEGSSDLVSLRYHMGPVLSSAPINIYLIWYGRWANSQKLLIKDFIHSISPSAVAAKPSVSDWWRTVSLYTDQTGANVSRSILIAGEYVDSAYSHGDWLNKTHNPTSDSFSSEIRTFPSRSQEWDLPYTDLTGWKQCPEVCAYPFAVPGYMGGGGPGELKPPNGDVGVDGMISVIGHELAELSSNPLVNAWYAGEDPTAPTEIGDLCEGLYGTGGGGGYIGQVMRDRKSRTFNLNGKRGRKFLVQWIWSPELKACAGPNALD